jgi:hypothetical protein
LALQRLISEDRSLRDGERLHREGLDRIAHEIQELHHRKNQLSHEYKQRVIEYDTHMAANRRWKQVVEHQLRTNTRNADSATYVFGDFSSLCY